MSPQTHEGSSFVRHIPCEACGSRDNNSEFSDGHTFCFGCNAYTKGGGTNAPQQTRRVPLDLIQGGEIQGLRLRKITDETCQHFNYRVAEYKGKKCQVAPYYDVDGNIVAQKIRFADKTFKVLGSLDDALPFGSQAFQKSGRQVVVTEGEIDAMSLSQAQGNKWPVVSIACGAGGQTRKYIARHRDYFLGFEKVVLMFDNDAPGKEAAEIAASVIGRRAHIAELPVSIGKDANDFLVRGETEALINAMWKAQPWRPEGIVELSSLREAVKEAPETGLSFPWPELTKLLYGIRLRMIVGLGSAVGSGKTDFFTQIINHLSTVHKQACGVFYLETPPVETVRRIAGKHAGKPFHVPDAGWTNDELDAALTELDAGGRIFLYDSFGNADWNAIREKIEYLYHAEGVQYFFIDHLTALAAWQEDERKALEVIMSEMGGLVQQIPITIFYVSHLATPEGKPHEEGGRVMMRHFKGSRAIAQWTTDAIALERNQQADDEAERTTTTVRILKERLTGRGTGKTFWLGYDPNTGLLEETTDPESRKGSTHGFTDEKTHDAAPDGGRSDF